LIESTNSPKQAVLYDITGAKFDMRDRDRVLSSAAEGEKTLYEALMNDRVLVDSRPFPVRSFCHYSLSRVIGKLYDVKRNETTKHV
jgi:hypothetical protein